MRFNDIVGCKILDVKKSGLDVVYLKLDKDGKQLIAAIGIAEGDGLPDIFDYDEYTWNNL